MRSDRSRTRIALSVVIALAAALVPALGAAPAASAAAPAILFSQAFRSNVGTMGTHAINLCRPSVGDLNSDGYPDIAVVGPGADPDHGMSIFMSSGRYQYSEPTTYTTPNGGHLAFIGNFMGDANLDVMVQQWGGGRFWSAQGDGHGSIGSWTTDSGWGNLVADVRVKDYDDDGYDDVYYISQGQGLVVRRCLGDGTFQYPYSYMATDFPAVGWSLEVGDVTGDGTADVVVSTNSGRVNVFQGSGGAALTPIATITVDPSSQLRDIALGDVTGDGKLDIVTAGYKSGGAAYVLRNDGSGGTAWSSVATLTPPVSGYPIALELADLDNDDALDVALLAFTGRIDFFHGDGAGHFSGAGTWQPEVAGNANLGLTAADLDGDLKVDLAYAGTNSNTLVLADNGSPARIRRVSGPNRYATAAAVSASVPGTAPAVVIATGEKFPDALSASALAGAVDVPLLLVSRASIPASVTAELTRLQPKKAYIIGGPSSVDTAVADALAAPPYSLDVTRVAGSNRYDTSRKVAVLVRSLQAGAMERVFVARGDDFPDALAAAPLAARMHYPLILTEPSRLSDEASAALKAVNPDKAILIGNAVTEDVRAAISAKGVTTYRVAGASRYKTAASVAATGVANGWVRWTRTFMATGVKFPDALSGGTTAGRLGGLLLLTPPASLDATVSGLLHDNREPIGEVVILGGTGTVSDGVKTSIYNALK
jgi:hypothetical protein